MTTMQPEEPNPQYYGSPPQDHIAVLRPDVDVSVAGPAKPSYGIDSPKGLLLSNVLAPLYLYASLKGKFDLWDELLSGLSDKELRAPSLDVGCGRGMVLLAVAQRKKSLLSNTATAATVHPAFGVDIFNSADQTGNAPTATYMNAAALDVLNQTVLHSADFTALPFADDVFALVTASLSIHNAPPEGRHKAIAETARVCRPGGLILVVDLLGYVADYKRKLESEGWHDVRVDMGGARVMFGGWPCQILKARKPVIASQQASQ